jgi:cyclophilin family peptidyl-prolyl cis-trans isomerase
MQIEVFPEWAPLGAEQFKEMVKDIYFDNTHIFRVVSGSALAAVHLPLSHLWLVAT